MYTINSPELIAACGLYCGACRKYKKGKCRGCAENEEATWCKIRKCCLKNGFHTCAECNTDVKECKHHNTFINKLVSTMFNSDRAACIRYIRNNGEVRFAEKMSWDEQMTFRKRVKLL